MDTVIPGLYASTPEPLGFGPSLEIRAFVLERERGNLLIYRSAALERDVEVVNDLGGISRQYLNHWHEASPACDWVSERFGAPLLCHAEDAPRVSETCDVAETFSERHVVDDDFEVIPTPGHTAGATAFLWYSSEHRVLLTGDTIFFPRGEWVAAVLETSDRQRYIESLRLIRDLDFDIIVPSITSAGQPYHAVVNHSEAARHIGKILKRLRNGDDH